MSYPPTLSDPMSILEPIERFESPDVPLFIWTFRAGYRDMSRDAMMQRVRQCLNDGALPNAVINMDYLKHDFGIFLNVFVVIGFVGYHKHSYMCRCGGIL